MKNPDAHRGIARLGRFATVPVLMLTMALPAPPPAAADQWLVYIGGGLESIADKGWKERRGQVLFTQRNGTLVSVPFDQVDLATSAFVTFQLNGRRLMPPRTAVPSSATVTDPSEPAPCLEARVVALRGSETLEVRIGDQNETVHLACLDAPETDHRFPQLAWFGRAAHSWMQIEIREGTELCLVEHTPSLRDGAGHRIVYVSSTRGRDYTAAAIGGGYGVLRAGDCSRAAQYSLLEGDAIAEERGLWGHRAESAAVAAVSSGVATSAGPPPRRPRRSGGG